MQSLTKRRLSAEELDILMRGATGVGCRLEAELTDGWFNTAYRVRFDDGRAAVVKLAPPADAPVLRYERGIMATEALVYRRLAPLADGGVPTPELLYAGDDFLAVSVLDGTPWDKAADRLPVAAERALRRELGGITARLHTLVSEDGRFGYPAPESGLSAPDWRTAFTAMVEALLEDAAHWRSPLGVPPAQIRALVAAGADALDEVTRPCLVHFDLWPGNIFVGVSDGTGARDETGACDEDGSDAPDVRITGLIDHERAFWGDPAAELTSLEFGGDIGPDSDLVTGYRQAGGRLDFTPALRHRLALYGLYLGLLLVVECSPRGYDEDRVAWSQGFLAERVSALRALG
ncbi:phosphotransferase family protein [Streptomyces sp. NBC_00582]|uniref:phosphotransferase family protein n=1 Tax=Streptomyces sp. NBC_00582 TaxID=2975783 RepID=UPI002E8025BA|nr:aminoglycoside phosphotransferase family protein [Streptomyces sp. NBC_00582]WUB66356.1 aminoglycoside phosphotransferase family protein [Streptomyces sp. NBC_00582]